jgi:predicted nucleic acid-binding protein
LSVLIDSNILLDLMSRDSEWFAWSDRALRAAGMLHRLIINPVIYAEVSVRFKTIGEADEALPESLFEREAIPFPAAFLAGKAFSLYRGRGDARRSPLPDFFIGAHAAIAGHRLLTRDARRYREYFPKLELIAP